MSGSFRNYFEATSFHRVSEASNQSPLPLSLSLANVSGGGMAPIEEEMAHDV